MALFHDSYLVQKFVPPISKFSFMWVQQKKHSPTPTSFPSCQTFSRAWCTWKQRLMPAPVFLAFPQAFRLCSLACCSGLRSTWYLNHPFRGTSQLGRTILPSTTMDPTGNPRVSRKFIVSWRHLRFNRWRKNTFSELPYLIKNISFWEMR